LTKINLEVIIQLNKYMSKEEEPVKLSRGDKIGCGIVAGVVIAGALTGFGFMLKHAADDEGIHRENNLADENKLMQERGLLGDHSIIDLREVPGFNFNGNVAGGFLIIEGTFHGETTQMLEFAWKPRADESFIQISSIPTKNVKYFIVDDPNIQPTV
jgi:hypothetical protein